MPRYYRHIRQSDRLIEDPEGIERPNLDAARTEALNGIRDLLAEAIKQGKDDLLDDAIVIADETGRELMTIPFIEALPPRLSEALLAVASSTSKSP
ncbi:DUF6894 family protein [Microvirga arabica]|uniref:DUF6894 family protein n=1 Tax=Microvirga arabica TaxID=1128671 RepID=UPI00193A1B07|nr:hypothetical protein [Microvirga arabica]MBM1169882.1 hypothetical protein [Microvirga arabica]